jgi:fibro-slime domain-containing protein
MQSQTRAARGAWSAAAVVVFGAAAQAQDIQLQGIVRDFRPSFLPGGHPDFEQVDPTMPDKKYIAWLVEPVLGDDGRPVFNAGGWKQQSTGGSTQRILDLEFLDLFTGWAVGDGGLILHTRDAGKSWVLQISGVTSNLTAVCMIDDRKGWAVSNAADLLYTSDGGTTWIPRTPSPAWPTTLRDVQFIGTDYGYAVGTGGFFATTDDGGTTWATSVVPGAPAPNLQNVCFLNAFTGFAVGGAGGAGGIPVILKTTDRGGSWTAMTLPAGLPATVVLNDIRFASATHAWAVGTAGTILKSVDGGSVWTAQASGVAVQINAIDFPVNNQEGWAAANGGRILATVDGGTTWTASVLPGAGHLYDVAFPTDHYGFCAGENSLLWRYDHYPTIVRQLWQSAGGVQRLAETMFRAHTTDWMALLGNSGAGSIDSPSTFAQWFRDELGVNLSSTLNLTLVRQADGSLWFSSKDQEPYKSIGGFFPIDGQLFGNPPFPYVPGAPDHNFNLTYETHAGFQYQASANPTVFIRSDDDVWLFIDGKLALAMAGVHWGIYQNLDLGRLRLRDGQLYSFDLFYAERQCCEAILEIRVNFDLVPYAPTTISNTFD